MTSGPQAPQRALGGDGPRAGSSRVRRGAHRTRRRLVAAVMPSFLAVAAVAALVTALAVWQGEQPDRARTDAAAAAAAAERSTDPTTGGATASPSATAKAAAQRTTEAAPAPVAGTTTGAAADGPTASAAASAGSGPQTQVEGTKKARTPKPPAVDHQGDWQVVVLNQTSRNGLAASVAAQLRAAGWDVPGVGNFRGTVPSTTVYYPPGGEAAALAVAADLRSPPRTLPRFGNLSTTRLTVVLTDSYQG